MTSLNQEGEGQRPREEVLEGIIDIFNEKGKAFWLLGRAFIFYTP